MQIAVTPYCQRVNNRKNRPYIVITGHTFSHSVSNARLNPQMRDLCLKGADYTPKTKCSREGPLPGLHCLLTYRNKGAWGRGGNKPYVVAAQQGACTTDNRLCC